MKSKPTTKGEGAKSLHTHTHSDGRERESKKIKMAKQSYPLAP